MKKVPSFQDLLYNPAVPPRKNGRIANTVVYHYLKNHENPGVQQLASKLQKEVPILLNEKTKKQSTLLLGARKLNFSRAQKVPSLQELLKPFKCVYCDSYFTVRI